MSTPLLLIVAILALVGQVAISPLGSKPLWVDALFVVGLNFTLALLLYAAAGRFDDWKGLIPGLAKSTEEGLRGIALLGVIALLLAVVGGMFVGPLFWNDAPTVNWSVMQMWPVFIFVDAFTVLVKRWRESKKVTELTPQVPT